MFVSFGNFYHLDLAENSPKSFYETITYSNGPGYEYHHPTSQSDVGSCSEECTEVSLLQQQWLLENNYKDV